MVLRSDPLEAFDSRSGRISGRHERYEPGSLQGIEVSGGVRQRKMPFAKRADRYRRGWLARLIASIGEVNYAMAG